MLCKDEIFQKFSRVFPHQPGHTSLQAGWGPTAVVLVGQDAARSVHSLLGWDGGTGTLCPCCGHASPQQATGMGLALLNGGSPCCSQSLLSIINHAIEIAAYTVSCLQDFPD